jgi:hypothetical protein
MGRKASYLRPIPVWMERGCCISNGAEIASNLEAEWMNVEAEATAYSFWQFLSSGDVGMGSFIFDGSSNSVAKTVRF